MLKSYVASLSFFAMRSLADALTGVGSNVARVKLTMPVSPKARAEGNVNNVWCN